MAARNEAKAMKEPRGLRVFATPQGPEAARGLRSCILDALLPLMPMEMREVARERILPLLLEEEDTAMSKVVPVLAGLGFRIRCVSGRYLGGKEAPLLTCILKERDCKLILGMRLRKDGY